MLLGIGRKRRAGRKSLNGRPRKQTAVTPVQERVDSDEEPQSSENEADEDRVEPTNEQETQQVDDLYD